MQQSVPTYGSGKLPQPILESLAKENPNSFIRVVKPQYVDASIEQGTDRFYQQSADNLNALIDGGFIYQRLGIWCARRMGGRPRKAKDTKPREALTLRIDADMVAALDAHPLRRFMSRNDLIAFLLSGALKL